MAYTLSGLYLHTVAALFSSTAITGALNFASATNKISLVSSAATDGSAPVNFSIADSHWVTTQEVSGTGWASGGVVLNVAATGATSTVPVMSESTVTAGSLRMALTNNISVASTTLTNAQGCIFYSDPTTAPSDLADAMIVSVCFGSAYSTNNGTFGITFTTDGSYYDIFKMDITP
jgi:hypothetical protein